MINSKYSTIKAAMHAYSHSPLAKGQKWLDQANGIAGHTVSFDKVRAEQIPVIVSIEDRDTKFLEVKDGKRIVGGDYGAGYASVLKFIDMADIREIPNTNGESFVIVDSMNKVYSNFISPTDKPINSYSLSYGYELKMYSEDGETEISRNVGWSFDYFSGIIHFDSASKPSSNGWKYGRPKIEGFVYVGKFISDIIDSFADATDTVSEAVDAVEAAAIAVQPYKFSTLNMTVVGEPYPIEYSNIGVPDYFQMLSIIIPAYVFEVTALDRDETILTEIRHLSNGNSQIFLDVPWYIPEGCPIIRYEYDSGLDGVGNRTPVLGKYKFLATAFVTTDGKKIPVKQAIDYEAHDDAVIPIPAGPYEPSTPYEPGTPISTLHAPRFPRGSNGMNFFSDDDVIVNVNNFNGSHNRS